MWGNEVTETYSAASNRTCLDPPSTRTGADFYYNEPFTTQYSLAIYYGFATIANSGYPGTTPANPDEMIMAIAGAVISISFFAYILGFFFNFLVSSDQNSIAFRGLMHKIDAYCQTRGLPDELRRRIIRREFARDTPTRCTKTP